MSKVDDQEIWRARQQTNAALEILEAAKTLNSGVNAYFEKPNAGQDFGLALLPTSGDEAFNLQTPFGRVEALFDLALLNGRLVGRYSFLLVRPLGAGSRQTESVWSMLINHDYMATWSASEGFDWYFGDQNAGRIARFLLTISAHVQRTLPELQPQTGPN